MIAPAIKAALSYVPLPARTWVPLEHLNFDPVPSKNVPIFTRQLRAVQNRDFECTTGDAAGDP